MPQRPLGAGLTPAAPRTESSHSLCVQVALSNPVDQGSVLPRFFLVRPPNAAGMREAVRSFARTSRLANDEAVSGGRLINDAMGRLVIVGQLLDGKAAFSCLGRFQVQDGVRGVTIDTGKSVGPGR